ncbi:hypothetical protein [Oceaniglobus ichthyenteri]|uniref:hypothetical protein n=1 Tax=Oceaniglobus ichthyenteri TaxID=2136177 RepID=UPI000F82DBDE|nr:hypothetical protein [Oceaniglobus ichthyenteri]
MTLRSLILMVPVVVFTTGALAQSVPLTMPVDPETAKISVVTDEGITSTAQLPTTALRDLRRAMNEGAVLEDDDLRALADRGDSVAAWKLVKRLRVDGGAPADVAHYAATAAAAGRVYALNDMIQAMHRLEPGQVTGARLNHLIAVLYAHAWVGNSVALDAVISFNGEGRLFGALSDATRARILEQAETMDGRVELRFALDLLAKDDLSEAEKARATSYLAKAQASKNLAVMTTAQNLIALMNADTAQGGIQN